MAVDKDWVQEMEDYITSVKKTNAGLKLAIEQETIEMQHAGLCKQSNAQLVSNMKDQIHILQQSDRVLDKILKQCKAVIETDGDRLKHLEEVLETQEKRLKDAVDS